MPPKGGTPENLKPFKKGQSGNPKGRPKGSFSFKKTIYEEMEKTFRTTVDGKRQTIEVGRGIIKAIALKAMKGDVRAAQFLQEVIEGKPISKHEIEGSLSLMDELYNKAKKHEGEDYANGKSAKKR